MKTDLYDDSQNLSWGGRSERSLNELHPAHRDLTPRYQAALANTQGAVERYIASKSRPRCTVDHEAIKQSPAWQSLKYIGIQHVEAWEGEPAYDLELRNCACGTTLARVKS
jgi:hypothetical protein